jgi:hypothetical protein
LNTWLTDTFKEPKFFYFLTIYFLLNMQFKTLNIVVHIIFFKIYSTF